MNLTDAIVPARHSLSRDDQSILRLLMLAHRHSLHVWEFPLLDEHKDRFVFLWHKYGRAIEVLLDPEARPPTDEQLRGRT